MQVAALWGNNPAVSQDRRVLRGRHHAWGGGWLGGLAGRLLGGCVGEWVCACWWGVWVGGFVGVCVCVHVYLGGVTPI